MRIALDATPLTEPSGGISRYTSELSRALARCFPEDEYWLLSDQPFTHPAPDIPNLRAGSGPRNPLERRWWLWGLQGQISRLRVELFHGTDFAVPYVPVRPTVLTLHDLSPWLEASWHAAADRIRNRTPVLLRLGLATLVITPSEAVRKDVLVRFRLAPDRVVAIPEAASERFRPVPRPPPEVPYFLFVGTLEPRKNISLLLDAWREARKKYTVDLVVVGRTRSDFATPEPEPGLTVRGAVQDESLPELYSGARAVVYPSLYEGFGLPVLEAMQCGAAVFTSLDPAITETAGGAAVQLDVRDPKAWADALIRAIELPEWIAGIKEKSLERAADFSWEKTAVRTRDVYEEAKRRFRK